MNIIKTTTFALSLSLISVASLASDLSLKEQDYASKSSAELLMEAESYSGWSAGGQGLALDLPADLSQNDFEDEMKTNFYGSYVFYKRLSTDKKEQVFELYLDEASIDLVRDETVRLLSMR